MIYVRHAHRFLTVLLLGMLTIAPTLSQGDSRLTLTHPQASWSLHINLPAFTIGAQKLYRDGTQVWVDASSADQAINLTIFIEQTTKLKDARACRKYYLKKLKRVRTKPLLSERGLAAVADFPVPENEGNTTEQKHFNAFLFKDGFCVDLHISKADFRPGEETLFQTILETVEMMPASQQEIANLSMYKLSSGPREELLLQAAQLLRDKDFSAADALLYPLCPWETGEISDQDRRRLPECSLRTAEVAEARELMPAEALASIYWRAADRFQRSGMLNAAYETYLKSLALNPNKFQTWYSLGHLHRDNEDWPAAAKAFNRALELKPDDPDTLYWIATNLMDQDLLPEAGQFLDRVLKVDSTQARVWYRRGQLEMRRGNLETAIAHFEKAQVLGVDRKVVQQQIRDCRDAMAARKDGA